MNVLRGVSASELTVLSLRCIHDCVSSGEVLVMHDSWCLPLCRIRVRFLVEVQGAQSRAVMEEEGSRNPMSEADRSSSSSSVGNEADPDDNMVYK